MTGKNKLRGWMATDMTGQSLLFSKKPRRFNSIWLSNIEGRYLGEWVFSQGWQNDPWKVKIKIKGRGV